MAFLHARISEAPLMMVLLLCAVIYHQFLFPTAAVAGSSTSTPSSSPASARRLATSKKNDVISVPDQFRYLYMNDERNRDRDGPHVIEHIAPPSREEQASDRPDFLFSTRYEPRYRVVIFYIDWCPVCRGVVGEYIEFGRRMRQYGVETHAVSCMAQRSLCLRLKIAGYPMVRMYGPGEIDLQGHDLALAELHPLRVLEQFRIPVAEDAKRRLNVTWTASSLSSSSSDGAAGWGERLAGLAPWNWLHGSSRRRKPPYRRTSQEIESDAHRSLDMTLRTSVFQAPDEPLGEGAREALLDFLLVLDKVLPPTWTALHGLVHELSSNFLFASKSEDYLVSFLDRSPPQAPSWSPYCSHGSPTAGYSCGLWTLFHAVTVGAVEFNSMSLHRNRIGTERVARFVRNVVHEFFSCAECKAHFVSSFDKCDFDRCRVLAMDVGNVTTQREWQHLPLWLFKVHNSVNLRRAAEIKSGKRRLSREERKFQPEPELWPRRVDCPPCWLSGSAGATGQDAHHRWNDDVVYQYLKLEYFSGYPNATTAKVPSGYPDGTATLTFREDPTDVSLHHVLVSCALVGLGVGLWEAARSGMRRVARKLKV
jgi:thiol oxidase